MLLLIDALTFILFETAGSCLGIDILAGAALQNPIIKHLNYIQRINYLFFPPAHTCYPAPCTSIIIQYIAGTLSPFLFTLCMLDEAIDGQNVALKEEVIYWHA